VATWTALLLGTGPADSWSWNSMKSCWLGHLLGKAMSITIEMIF